MLLDPYEIVLPFLGLIGLFAVTFGILVSEQIFVVLWSLVCNTVVGPLCLQGNHAVDGSLAHIFLPRHLDARRQPARMSGCAFRK